MSVTGQPYSDAALKNAREADRLGGTTLHLLDAAHDRERLGLEASVHAAAYRREVIQEVVGSLQSLPSRHPDRKALSIAADFLLREFGAIR